jgi:RecA-family ATPase
VRATIRKHEDERPVTGGKTLLARGFDKKELDFIEQWLGVPYQAKAEARSTESAPSAEPRVWSLKELAATEFPPIEGFLRENVLTRQSLSAIIGRNQSGKTFLALSIAAAVAKGQPLGHLPTSPGKPVFVSCEMSEAQIARRIKRLFSGREIEEFRDTVRVICKPEWNFETRDGVKRAAEFLGQLDPDLIFFDALSDTKGAIDENSNDEMGALGRWIRDDIATALDANACALPPPDRR